MPAISALSGALHLCNAPHPENVIICKTARQVGEKGDQGMAGKNTLIVTESIEAKILLIRGQKVMLDADLAELYGVETRRLNEQVRRNSERFPEDFMFQLTAEEFENLKSQFATSSWGGRRKLPYVFTEHGAIMAASVLNSTRAIEISVHVVRAFVRLRELVSTHKELSQKLNQLERKVGAHDRAIAELINAIRQLMSPSEPKKKRPIGFATWKEKMILTYLALGYVTHATQEET